MISALTLLGLSSGSEQDGAGQAGQAGGAILSPALGSWRKSEGGPRWETKSRYPALPCAHPVVAVAVSPRGAEAQEAADICPCQLGPPALKLFLPAASSLWPAQARSPAPDS